MTIDITEQVGAITEARDAAIREQQATPASLFPGYAAHLERRVAILSAILATLEKVAAEERPERMQ